MGSVWTIIGLFVAAFFLAVVGFILMDMNQSPIVQYMGWGFIGGSALTAIRAVVLAVKRI